MNIFLLEDELMQQHRLERLIREIIFDNNWFPKEIIVTAKPDYLVKEASKAQGKNIYFLDIEIREAEHRGLEVAQEIRKFDPYGLIIFVTTHSEFAPLTYRYKVSALDFISKDSEENLFKQQIKDCLALFFNPDQQLVAEEAFIFENKNSHFQVPFYDILYFETSETSHKIRMIGKNKRIEFYANLDEIEKLDPRFFKCHRSFVVNLANIESVDRSENMVYFNDNCSCLISRRKSKKVIDLIKELRK